MISEYRLTRRVQFYETDAAGMVHFSWLYRYLEEAEHALWREAGLSIAPAGSEIGFPRIAASFDFHKPLHFEDQFEVYLVISEIGEKIIRYDARITRGEVLIATGSLTVACVRKRVSEPMKTIALSPEIVRRFRVGSFTNIP